MPVAWCTLPHLQSREHQRWEREETRGVGRWEDFQHRVLPSGIPNLYPSQERKSTESAEIESVCRGRGGVAV